MNLLVPAAASIIGALVFALTGGKLSRIGELLLFVGLLWTVYVLAGVRLHF